jgi:hypothetical protein
VPAPDVELVVDHIGAGNVIRDHAQAVGLIGARSLRNLLSAHQGCCRRGLGIHSDGFVLDLNRLFGLGNRKRKVGADIAARTEDEFLLFPGEASQFNG